jgi:hypothetical protein
MVWSRPTVSEPGYEQVAGCFELAYKPLGSVKCGEFLE